jgi:hypothetical protein
MSNHKKEMVTEKKKPIIVKIVSIMILSWSFWLFLSSLFHATDIKITVPSFDVFFLLLIFTSAILPLMHIFIFQPIVVVITLIYLISSIYLLQWKNWARRIVAYLSISIVAFYIIHFLFMAISIKTLQLARGDARGAAPVRLDEIFSYLCLSSYTLIPALAFSFYFTRSKVKKQFNEPRHCRGELPRNTYIRKNYHR